MKNIFAQRPVSQASSVLVLCLVLLFPCFVPEQADATEPAEAMLLAADGSGSSLPVIPKVPERSRRVTRQAMDAVSSEVPATNVVTPPSSSTVVVPPMNTPSPVVTTPVPVTAPGRPAAVPTPSVAVPEAVPAPVVYDPVTEPVAPRPAVTATPKRTTTVSRDSGYAQSTPRRRTKRYDPNLVGDPSPAEPYVTREIPLDGSFGGSYGTMMPSAGATVYSTHTGGGVSNPLPFEPRTYVSPQYFGGPVSSGARAMDTGAYSGSAGSAWPSGAAGAYDAGTTPNAIEGGNPVIVPSMPFQR